MQIVYVNWYERCYRLEAKKMLNLLKLYAFSKKKPHDFGINSKKSLPVFGAQVFQIYSTCFLWYNIYIHIVIYVNFNF